MTEAEARALEQASVVFLCDGIEFEIVELLPEPDE
jgi:hypothetical protein